VRENLSPPDDCPVPGNPGNGIRIDPLDSARRPAEDDDVPLDGVTDETSPRNVLGAKAPGPLREVRAGDEHAVKPLR
jgi:hypothetical protein